MTSDSHLGLMAEVAYLLEQFTGSAEKPPFSTAELVVMAVICEQEMAVTKATVFSWVTETFPYYSLMAVEAHIGAVAAPAWYSPTSNAQRATLIEQVLPGIDEAAESYEMPLVNNVYGIDDPFGMAIVPNEEYRVQAGPARIFLRGYLNPGPSAEYKDTPGDDRDVEPRSRFFDLPAELRNRIYDLLFLFDKRGVTVTVERGPCTISLPCREFNAHSDNATGCACHVLTDPPCVKYIGPPLAEVLAPLGTCQQFYDEAMPIFYRDNHFCFPYLGSSGRAFSQLAPSRIRHLTDICIGCEPDAETLDELDLPRLRRGFLNLDHANNMKKVKLQLGTCDWWLELLPTVRGPLGMAHSGALTHFSQIEFFPELLFLIAHASEMTIFILGDGERFWRYHDDAIGQWFPRLEQATKRSKAAETQRARQAERAKEESCAGPGPAADGASCEDTAHGHVAADDDEVVTDEVRRTKTWRRKVLGDSLRTWAGADDATK
ncbi:hypothetical protein LTR53_003121 [Teratosphaeriaceae sp. CCFEE 6253]|nr:hypothetical protein LTR53_003121 [Teratosphaeriaceae sp. CCFEE 6253]